jgi:hypothetical protein
MNKLKSWSHGNRVVKRITKWSIGFNTYIPYKLTTTVAELFLLPKLIYSF